MEKKTPKKSARTERTDRARTRFMSIIKKTGNVSLACRALKISRTAAYMRRDPASPTYDPSFAEEWDNAIAEAIDHLEGEAWRRAFKGCKKPVYQQGQLVGYVQEYSDTLMSLLLKAHKKEKYSDKTVTEHQGEITINKIERTVVKPKG